MDPAQHVVNPWQDSPSVRVAQPTRFSRRIAITAATGLFLTASALPVVALFPEPPAFGRGSAGIVSAVAILATLGTSFRGTNTQRTRISHWAALLFVTTAVAVGLNILIARAGAYTMPTINLLPRVFGLQGEDVGDAVLYEAWLEVWLVCAAVAVGLDRVRRAVAGYRRDDVDAVSQAPSPPWNAATVLLWLLGWAALASAVLDGHWTATFLAHAAHVTGTIASVDAHPRIRFVTETGQVVEFRQNGSVSRPDGAEVPVAYDTRDPSGPAQADTF